MITGIKCFSQEAEHSSNNLILLKIDKTLYFKGGLDGNSFYEEEFIFPIDDFSEYYENIKVEVTV